MKAAAYRVNLLNAPTTDDLVLNRQFYQKVGQKASEITGMVIKDLMGDPRKEDDNFRLLVRLSSISTV